LVSAISILISFLQFTVKAEGWNDILPLKSTRGDVIKKLGKCKTNDSSNCRYDSVDGRIFIMYASGNCNQGDRWKVREGVVLSISFYPVKQPKVTSLQIDLKDFAREEDPELPGIINLNNQKIGLSLVVENETVRAFYFLPTKDEEDKFSCRK
jgi:hypothetical protein